MSIPQLKNFMAEFKFPCPRCGQQIQCDTGYSGTQINCPACKRPIVVPQMPGSGAPAAQPPVPAQARTGRNILVIGGSGGCSCRTRHRRLVWLLEYKVRNVGPNLIGWWKLDDGSGNCGERQQSMPSRVMMENWWVTPKWAEAGKVAHYGLMEASMCPWATYYREATRKFPSPAG